MSGNNLSIYASFANSTFSIVFDESGLPAGTPWYVNFTSGPGSLGAIKQETSGSTIAISLPNGTYSYTVDKVSDYNSTPASGQFTVSGNSPSPIQISFAKNATVPPVIPTPNNPGIWSYIIGIIIGAAVTAVVAVTVYYFRKR